MKKSIFLLPFFALLVACTPKVKQVAETVAPKPMQPKLMSFKDSVSYYLGASNAKQLKTALPDSAANIFSEELYMLGLKEGFAEKGLINEGTGTALVNKFQQEMQKMAAAEAEAKAAGAKKKGMDYLAENAKKEGVMTTNTGLQYKVITEGTGATPSAADRVEVHYEGRLIDGTVFDSSYKRGSTATFGVGQVISGWTEALQLMKEGSKYQLYIPSDLAYGDRGSGKIGPGDVLIFDVELIKIVK